MASPFRPRSAQLHAKIEDAFTSISAGDVFAGLAHPDYKSTFEQNERDDLRPSYMKFANIPGGIMADLGVSHYLKGSGDAADTPPEFGEAWKLCGMSETVDPGVSVTYKPDTTQNSPGSVSWNSDGQLHVLENAFGNWEVSGVSGKLATVKMGFKGAYVDVTDTAFVGGATYDVSNPVALRSVTASMFGASTVLLVRAFNFNFGANLSMLQDMQSASAYKGGFYGDRRIKGQIVVAAPDLSDVDFYDLGKTATAGAVSFSWGVAGGNLVTITASQAVVSQPTASVDNDLLIMTVDFSVSADGASAEGDDFSVVFT